MHSRRPLPLLRRADPRRRWAALLLSLASVGTLGFTVYLVSTSVPYLASAASTDPTFGALNSCLLGTVPSRVGFSPSPDARQAAAYSGQRVGVCARLPDGGTEGHSLTLPGVAAAAFDFSGTLWLATGKIRADSGDPVGAGEPQLWHVAQDAGAPEQMGDFAPVALAGHAQGVVALDGTGHLVSLAADGRALAFARLPRPPLGGALLAANVDGSLVSVVAGTGLFVFRADDLSLVRAESPCEVEYLWWKKEPSVALLACAPRGSWTIELEVLGGRSEEAPGRRRERSVLAGPAGVWVQPCDVLPCSAPAP